MISREEGFRLSPKQEEARKLLGGPQMHTLLFGGSRSGKTFLFVRCVIVRAIRGKESRHAVARLHNVDVRQSVMADTFPKVMRLCFPKVEYELNKTDQFARFENGSEIWFVGLDDSDRVDKVLGKEFSTIYVNEASQVPYSSVEVLRTRLAQAVIMPDGSFMPLRGYYDLNPTGRSHWSYQEFIQYRKPTGEKIEAPWDFEHMVLNPADNPFLPPQYLKALEGLSSRQRKRFLEGQYLADIPGALWNTSMIEANRIPSIDINELDRIVVAIDPQISNNEDSDETGIIVAGVKGRGSGAKGYVLQDLSDRYTPAGWAKVATDAFDRWKADRIVAEGNQGGEMVRATIQNARPNAPIKIVHASRGKEARAEPVAALYEEGRIHHVGPLRDKRGQSGLEDQMCSWVPGVDKKGSPDRVDATVWAFTELMLTGPVSRRREVQLG
jgi:phage terminase large subunit-like protein